MSEKKIVKAPKFKKTLFRKYCFVGVRCARSTDDTLVELDRRDSWLLYSLYQQVKSSLIEHGNSPTGFLSCFVPLVSEISGTLYLLNNHEKILERIRHVLTREVPIWSDALDGLPFYLLWERSEKAFLDKVEKMLQSVSVVKQDKIEHSPNEVGEFFESASLTGRELFLLEAFNQFSAQQLLEFLQGGEDGLSVRRLASEIGIPASQVGHILSGNRIPGDEQAKIIREFALKKSQIN